MATIGHDSERGPEKPGVCVKVLTARDRRALQVHFLALDGSARLLRFGMAFPDELITRYVQEINFARDTMFGVYDSELQTLVLLVGPEGGLAPEETQKTAAVHLGRVNK